MLSKTLPRLFSAIRRNPIFPIREFKVASQPEAVDYLKSQISSVRAPFVILDLRKFKDTDAQLTLLKDSIAEIKQSESRPIYVWSPLKFATSLRRPLRLTARQGYPRILLRQNMEQFFKFKNRMIASSNIRQRYEQRMKRLLESLRTKKVFRHYGYETYSRTVDKLFKQQDDSPPLQGYLREMVFEPKKFMKRMMKSKYFYYFVIFKIVGWTIKASVLIYIFYIKPRNKKKAEGLEHGDEVAQTTGTTSGENEVEVSTQKIQEHGSIN
jgi:hypothetical protein